MRNHFAVSSRGIHDEIVSKALDTTNTPTLPHKFPIKEDTQCWNVKVHSRRPGISEPEWNELNKVEGDGMGWDRQREWNWNT